MLASRGLWSPLINGRLVRPFAEALRLSKAYWIVCPKGHLRAPENNGRASAMPWPSMAASITMLARFKTGPCK